LTEIEVIDAPAAVDAERAAAAALAAAGVGGELHLAIAFVGPVEIAELNSEHRGIDRATDVLSFPVDETGATAGPRELGDVVICPDHTENLTEAVVHGVLHLCGMDHETDSGEMLALQDRVMGSLA
jgi:probable rRNA maturation factor